MSWIDDAVDLSSSVPSPETGSPNERSGERIVLVVRRNLLDCETMGGWW